MVTSDFRPEVEIRPFRECAMHPAIIIRRVRSLWMRLWLFLLFINHIVDIISNDLSINGLKSMSYEQR